MVIGIELNNILRDFNTQVMKYYKRDINPSFDETTVDKNCVNILDYLPFKGTKTTKNEFVFIDYPYELFGCAKTTSNHLHTEMYEWIRGMDNVKVVLFSTMESGLTIQSTYFFLSKGNKTRWMMFPQNCEEMWDICDVIITTNKRIVNSKPNGKDCILIRKTDNLELEPKCSLAYDNFEEVMHDEKFLEKLGKSDKLSIWKKIKRYFNNNK